MNDLTEYARTELNRLGNGELSETLKKCGLEVLDLLEQQGHHDMSARFLIFTMNRLLLGLPIKPLTGEDDEWEKVSEGKYVNKRCHYVFKEDGRGAYNINGKVFSDNGGLTWYHTSDSWVEIDEFPYFPPGEPEKIILGGKE